MTPRFVFFFIFFVIEFSGFRVSSSSFFCSCFRESAELLQATGMSISTKLHAFHGGGAMTTRYSSIYFNLCNTLMATTTGLRRTRNSCSSSCCQSYFVTYIYNVFFFTALRISLGEPPMGRRLARHVRYYSWTRPGQSFRWTDKLCKLGESTSFNY